MKRITAATAVAAVSFLVLEGAVEEAGGFEVGIVQEGIEAGTLLLPFVGIDTAVAVDVGREVAVAHDDGGGELACEALQEGTHTLALGLGAGVTGLARGIEAAFVADADTVLVVVLAVGSDLPQRTPFMDLAVAGDVVVVADVFPPSLQVVGLALPEGVALRGLRGAAVQNDEINGAHWLWVKS